MKKNNVIMLTVIGILFLIFCAVIIRKNNIKQVHDNTLYPLENMKVTGENNHAINGKVSICASLSEETSAYLQEQLQKEFPEVTVQIYCMDSEIVREAVMSKGKVQKTGYDMIMTDGTYVAAYLKNQGVLQAYKTPEARLLVENYDRDGYWYPLGINHLVLAYNPKLYEKNEVSNTFKGFAEDSMLQRGIAIPDPEDDITGLTTVIALGEYYGAEYFDRMIEQEICLESQEEGIEKLINGTYKEMILDEKKALKRKAEGADIEIIYPTDLRISIPLSNMIMKEEYSANKNVEVCEMITDWLLSRNGQQCFSGEYLQSTRLDMKSNNINENSVRGSEEKWQSSYGEMQGIYMEFFRRIG